ncbi:uncharacterized protein LOC129949323 [Eupeodes corollae]|uniref:uncharacterized protein LOC129949323 n=1 Tax=Eupeodes corollae TaxID=290404 RepID=UPI00249199F1|nr:uncharacterized protein LOC129949323 [Eupeodes corollae]
MEAAVHRTDSQKNQPNGPRVSFNRDVHVKRIGTRPSEKSKIETKNLQPPSTQHLRRELPADLSEESIRKEAAHVLAQAEKIKCKAESGKNIPSQIKNLNNKLSGSNKFNSLPTRKKKSVQKPVTRSVSDASSKKSKKPSIFNIFSRKSDSNLNPGQQGTSRFVESGGRRLVRSKSDVGSNKESNLSQRKNSEKEDLATNSGKPIQLSPIIENAQKEEYFEELFNCERRKSEAITAHEKNATKLTDFLTKYNTEPKLSGNIGYTNHEDLDLVPSKPIAETIQALQQNKIKSLEDMHSSQIPPKKPTLTKGLTVNGMVKRLSMERFSPPPTISGPAFSYTRPNENIIYAQLVEEERPLKRPTAFKNSLQYSQNGKSTTYSSEDVLDYPSSHQTSSAIRIEPPSRVIISPEREGFSNVKGPTMIRIQKSPSPWQQLSPRNLSDDDEGLGAETRKYYEEESQHLSYDQRSKNHSDNPIVPIIRSVTPPDVVQPKSFNEINTLSRRRANLESRIRSRSFAPPPPETISIEYCASPDGYRVREEFLEAGHPQYTTPERDDYYRYHKLRTEEIMNKYSPERSYLDMIAPNKNNGHHRHHTSRYVHTKYYDDGTGRNKETYEREGQLDPQGKLIVRESRRRERLDSAGKSIDNNFTLNGYEPSSIDSHLVSNIDTSRSSPENHRIISKINSSEAETWQNSLKRDKLQQRSFDKGDSGIENDFRREAINGSGSLKWRKRTFKDDVAACELFIKKERRHTENQHPHRKRYDFVYRERSIDDGSHFDPRLDKYPKSSTSTLQWRNNKENSSQSAASSHQTNPKEDTLKRNKKVGSFQKVKLLFSGNRKKERESSVMTNEKSVSALDTGGIKDKYMVKEEEMRSRYREHRTSQQNDLLEPKIATDISMRRRLSTPKASPLLKRTSSESVRKNSTLARNTVEAKPEKSSWFKSIERRSKSKSKEKPYPPASIENDPSQLKHTSRSYRTPPAAPPIPPKNFRFFGDTDLDSNPPTISRAHTTQKSRPSVSTFNRAQKYSQSAFNLDRINQTHESALSNRLRSSSLHNLDEDGTDETDTRKRRHYSRSRNLDDISESGSETEDQYHRQPLTPVNRSIPREKLSHSPQYEDRKKNERHQTTSVSTLKKTSNHNSSIDQHNHRANVLPKPLRSAERRFHSREHQRLPDSSGTEGESSMQSQRSIVYLHATTVGAIPIPYQGTSERRRAASREDLRKNKLQPMTKSVSRSVSMLAPWKPKHMSEGYEINYSQEQNEKDKKLSTLPRKNTITQVSSNTLKRNKRTEQPSRSRRQSSTAKSKEDLSSIRNSSSTSAPKSNLSSTMDSRKESLRRK